MLPLPEMAKLAENLTPASSTSEEMAVLVQLYFTLHTWEQQQMQNWLCGRSMWGTGVFTNLSPPDSQFWLEGNVLPWTLPLKLILLWLQDNRIHCVAVKNTKGRIKYLF